MSMAMFAFLHKAAVPDREAWQGAISAAGFDLEIDPELVPFESSGHLACRLLGDETGFEIYYGTPNESFGRGWRRIAKGADVCISMHWGASMLDGAAVLIAGYALAEGFGAVVSYEDEGFTGKDQLRAEARTALAEVEREYSRPSLGPRFSQSVAAITADWAERFPGFTIGRSGWLMRRVGPLLQGIQLRSSSSDPHVYQPIAHITPLVRPSDAERFRDFPLCLGQSAPGKTGRPLDIWVKKHAERYQKSAELLRAQSVLPLDRPPTLAEVLEEMTIFARDDWWTATRVEFMDPWSTPDVIIEEIVLLAAALDDDVSVASGLALAAEQMQRWEPPVPRSRFRKRVGWEPWLEALTDRASDRDEVRRTVAARSEFHRLDELASFDMALA